MTLCITYFLYRVDIWIYFAIWPIWCQILQGRLNLVFLVSGREDRTSDGVGGANFPLVVQYSVARRRTIVIHTTILSILVVRFFVHLYDLFSGKIYLYIFVFRLTNFTLATLLLPKESNMLSYSQFTCLNYFDLDTFTTKPLF